MALMSDERRTALVEELAGAMGLVFGPGDVPPGPDEVAACLPIIDRLLAERHGETTVPDAERVERAAKAMFEEDARGFEDDASLPWDLVKRRWLRMARAALATAGVTGAGREGGEGE